MAAPLAPVSSIALPLGSGCTAPGCGRPAPDAFVCTGCLEQLRRDCWAIAGHPAHRSGPIRPLDADAQHNLDAHSGLAEQLVVTMARQDAPGEHVGRGAPDPGLDPERADQPIASTALPFSPSAADMLAELRTVLNMWVRLLLDRRGLPGAEHPGRDVAELAWWLGRHRQSVAADPAGGRLVAEVAALVPRVTRVVSPRQWEYLGPCLHWHCEAGPDRCQVCADQPAGPAEHLYCEAGSAFVRCGVCGRSYDTRARRAWLLEQAEDQLVTAEFAADALPRYLSPELRWLLEPRRIRRWGEHGQITVHRPHPGERVLDALGRSQRAPSRYKVRELLDMVQREAERSPRRAAADRDRA